MLDWLFSFFDKIAQNVLIKMLADHFVWVDWFALLFVVLGIVYGYQNGFIAEIAEIAQIMAVIFLTFENYKHLQSLVMHFYAFLPKDYVSGISYGVTGIAIWALFGILYKHLGKIFHTDVPKPLKTGGGALLGAVHLLIIFSFFCQTIILLPFPTARKPLTGGGSFSGAYIGELAPKIHAMFADPLKTLTDKEKKS